MKKNYLRILAIFIAMLPLRLFAEPVEVHTQVEPVVINKTIIQKIASLIPDSSNAHDVEKILGQPPCCCMMLGSRESWTCQWKGNLNSNRLENTINVKFEAGMLAQIIAITADGVYYTAKPGKPIKVERL